MPYRRDDAGGAVRPDDNAVVALEIELLVVAEDTVATDLQHFPPELPPHLPEKTNEKIWMPIGLDKRM